MHLRSPLPQTLTLPLWLVGMVLAVMVGVVLGLSLRLIGLRETQGQLRGLELQARKLQLELEAEKSKSETYGLEGVQLQQNLKLLESEINRLRAKVKLPPVQLVPLPASPPPKSDKAPKGAGQPIDVGALLLSLRSQMDNFSAELEDTAYSIENPLPNDPAPRPRRKRIVLPDANIQLSKLTPVPDYAKSMPSGIPLVTETHITSTFGYRSNPFGGRSYEFHNGMDFAADAGTSVYATAAGQVTEMGWNPIFGLMVLIDHGNGLHTLYGHLSSSYVAKGQQVDQGSLIGAVGSTGRSTGPHLHYSVFRYGAAVDPGPYVGMQ